MIRRSSTLLLFLALGCVATQAAAQDHSPTSRPPLQLGRETTILTGPLNEAGYPDYARAVNARMEPGTTGESGQPGELRKLS